MPDFQPFFVESKGKPIKFNDMTLVMSDSYQVTRGETLQITRESTNSEWRQGIVLSLDGEFEIAGELFPKSVVFWEDTAPTQVTCVVLPRPEQFDMRVWNVWDVGDEVVHSRHYGAAMTVEIIRNGRRYRCNDGHPDEDFDDIIFRIETVGEMAKG